MYNMFATPTLSDFVPFMLTHLPRHHPVSFDCRLDKLMRAHFKTLRDESAFMQEIRNKYPEHTGTEEGLLHHEL